MELLVDRESLSGYESALVRALFVSGDVTDTDKIRKHYRSRGFDPASILKGPLKQRLERYFRGSRATRHVSRKPALLLLVLSMIVLAISPLVDPVGVLYTFAPIAMSRVFYTWSGSSRRSLYRKRVERLLSFSLTFLLPQRSSPASRSRTSTEIPGGAASSHSPDSRSSSSRSSPASSTRRSSAAARSQSSSARSSPRRGATSSTSFRSAARISRTSGFPTSSRSSSDRMSIGGSGLTEVRAMGNRPPSGRAKAPRAGRRRELEPPLDGRRRRLRRSGSDGDLGGRGFHGRLGRRGSVRKLERRKQRWRRWRRRRKLRWRERRRLVTDDGLTGAAAV